MSLKAEARFLKFALVATKNQYGIRSNFIFFFVTVFDIIIHNVKSKTEYDRYQVIVASRAEAPDSPINLTDLVIPIVPLDMEVYHRVNFLTNHSPRRRFTYRTRFEATIEQNERIQELFRADNEYSRLTPAEWRRYIYDRHLYALPLPDVTGRHRECSAEYYR